MFTGKWLYNIYKIILKRFRRIPIEVLHTLLLGPYKYLLKEFVPKLTERMKEEVLARVNAFPHSGSPLRCMVTFAVTLSPLLGETSRDGLRWLFSF